MKYILLVLLFSACMSTVEVREHYREQFTYDSTLFVVRQSIYILQDEAHRQTIEIREIEESIRKLKDASHSEQVSLRTKKNLDSLLTITTEEVILRKRDLFASAKVLDNLSQQTEMWVFSHFSPEKALRVNYIAQGLLHTEQMFEDNASYLKEVKKNLIMWECMVEAYFIE